MLVEFYYFRSPDWSGKMTQARYVATLADIQATYPKHEIIGVAEAWEVRAVPPANFFAGFAPWVSAQRTPPPNVDASPELRPGEAALVQTFLRRYATWCARTKRYAQMQGAGALFRSLQDTTVA